VHRYIIAIGSNRRGRHGGPPAEVLAAATAIGAAAVSPVIATVALGPSIRRFANAVALVETEEPPPPLLARLKQVERAFGRRAGRRWGARVIDLDIVMWSGGVWRSPDLTVPHVSFRQRRFVLDPLTRFAPAWRDPITRLTARQLRARLTRPQPLPRRGGALRP
jgi:2-amino-4-hydroxy-6-hydroxymethyldihydropteridine diphosphokinase